ncbi:hypothetical protein ACHAPU_007456 [Fusarium lateritium]
MTDETRRSGGSELEEIFCQRSQFSTWRELWYYLAQSQSELGTGSIGPEVLAEMKDNLVVTDTALKRMGDHIYEFSQDAPATQGWINYDAPVTYVTKNTHVILISRALDLLIVKVLEILWIIQVFALAQRSRQCVVQSGDQPERMSTLGRIASEWALDLMKHMVQLKHIQNDLLLCGTQGKVIKPSQHFARIVETNRQVDALLCKKAGFSGCYNYAAFPGDTYNKRVNRAVGNAVAELSRTISRIVLEISRLHAKDIPTLAKNVRPKGLALTELSAEYVQRWWAMTSAIERRVGQSFNMPILFRRIDLVLFSFRDVVKNFGTFPLRIEASAGLQSVVSRKISEQMVLKGECKELVLENLRNVSMQTLKHMSKLGLPNDFFAGIKTNPFFEPVWNEVVRWYWSEKNTKHHEQATVAICGPDGTVDKGLDTCLESVKRVVDWRKVKEQAVLAEPKKRKKTEPVFERWEHPSQKSSNWRRDDQN